MATVSLFPMCSSGVVARIRLSQVCPPSPPVANLIVLSQNNCDTYGGISGGVSDVASEVAARSHGQVEPAVCGG